MTPSITLPSGRRVNPLDLRPADIDIRDIAHNLAMCNRFAGGTHYPISVAQHSVYVSLLASEAEPNPASWRLQALQGLLHDASEAYLGDVTKWLKLSDTMAPYREAEERAMRVISSVFDIPYDLTPEVEEADRLMVRYEHLVGFGFPIHHPPKYDYPGYGGPTEDEVRRIGDWRFVQWTAAESAFLARFDEVKRRMRRSR